MYYQCTNTMLTPPQPRGIIVPSHNREFLTGRSGYSHQLRNCSKTSGFIFNVSYKLQQTKGIGILQGNLSLRKTVSFEVHTDFQWVTETRKGAQNIKRQTKGSIWKESQSSCKENNHPPILEAQVTLTQEETEPSADQNLIRVQPKFKTALVY